MALLNRVRDQAYTAITSWALRMQYGGWKLRTKRWDGFAIGARAGVAKRIEHDLDLVFTRVEAVLKEELGVPTKERSRLYVVHCRTPREVNALYAQMRGEPPTPVDPAGAYIYERLTPVTSGEPGSFDFCANAAHELCHALSHALFGVIGCIPWVSEGYAHLVTDRVVRSLGFGSTLPRLYGALRQYHGSARAMSLRNLLLVRDPDREVPSDELFYFQCYAAVLLAFLRSRGMPSSKIGNVCRIAVKGKVRSCQQLLLMIEDALAMDIDGVEKALLRYVRRVGRSMSLDEQENARSRTGPYFRHPSPN